MFLPAQSPHQENFKKYQIDPKYAHVGQGFTFNNGLSFSSWAPSSIALILDRLLEEKVCSEDRLFLTQK